MTERLETYHPGQELVATFDFKGRQAGDLSFAKGDALTVVNVTSDPNYLIARRANQTGIIPTAYVIKVTSKNGHHCHQSKKSKPPWYHGNITREISERLLLDGDFTDGCFLVRDSTNYPGDYTLSILHQRHIEHYRVIVGNDGKLTVDEEGWFSSLEALVSHYVKDADGLCCALRQGLPSDRINTPGTVISRSNDALSKAINAKCAINMDDVQFFEAVGQGEACVVKRGLHLGNPVAIKTVKDPRQSVQLLAEAVLMSQLKHPNIVRLVGLGVVEKDGFDSVCLVMELLPKGSLLDYLRSRGRQAINKKDQLTFSIQVCHAMTFLEGKKIVHRDLAARNILLDENGIAKLSDFGLASEVGNAAPCGKGVAPKFPIKWTAPEALEEPSDFTSKSDVWSFGVLLWEIYSFGRVPYPRIALDDVVRFVADGYRMEAPEACPVDTYNLMKECWQRKPDSRPTFSSISQRLDNQTAFVLV